MPMHISRLGYQAIVEAAEVDSSVRHFLQTQGHRIVILSDLEETARLSQEREAVDALLQAVEESDDTDYSVSL